MINMINITYVKVYSPKKFSFYIRKGDEVMEGGVRKEISITLHRPPPVYATVSYKLFFDILVVVVSSLFLAAFLLIVQNDESFLLFLDSLNHSL